MKKIIPLTIMLTTLLILSACGASEYKENMKLGEEKLEGKSYEEAIQYFEKAQKADAEKVEPGQRILSANDSYFNSLFALGKEAFEKQQHAEAAELLEKAYAINPTKEESLLGMKVTAEELNKKQKELDSYMKWLGEAAQMNFNILKEWRTASDNVSIGEIKAKDFGEKAKALLKTSDKLVMSSEDQLANISGDLAATHTAYMANVQENHDQLRLVILEAQKEKVKPNELLALGGNLPKIREMHTLHVQSLKAYAQNLQLNFSEK